MKINNQHLISDCSLRTLKSYIMDLYGSYNGSITDLMLLVLRTSRCSFSIFTKRCFQHDGVEL